MGIESITTIHRGWSGQRDQEGGATYTCTDHVITDDPKDGPGNVLTYYQVAHRDLGSSYFIGNDMQVEATLHNIAAKQIDPLNWHVVGTYKVAPDKKNKDDKPEKNPRAWVDEIDISTAAYQEPVRQSIYMGQWDVTAPVLDRMRKMSPGCLPFDGAPNQQQAHYLRQGQPVTNSAGTVLDPPLMKDMSYLICRITRTAEEFDANAATYFANTLNDRLIQVRRLGLKFDIEPETAKMISITGQRKMHNRILYWEWTIEFHIKDEWYVDILDRGYAHAKNIDETNDHDTKHPFNSANRLQLPGSPSIHPSPAPVNILVDDAGHPIRDPVLLDGAGGVLGEDNPAKWLRYGIYPSVDWTPLKIDRDTDPEWLPQITATLSATPDPAFILPPP